MYQNDPLCTLFAFSYIVVSCLFFVTQNKSLGCIFVKLGGSAQAEMQSNQKIVVEKDE